MTDQHPKIRSIEIVPLPAFRDNYIWLIRRDRSAVVVDPGEARIVQHYLATEGLELAAVLLTHHHPDHVGGVETLVAGRDIPVYAPASADIAGTTRPVREGDDVALDALGLRLRVLEVAGHTASHVAYLGPGILFPGDTLFSAGCGRLLGGTAAQLHASLQRLASLPADTAVYCTHEYTLANLAFARVAEPSNTERDAYLLECEALRDAGKPTLPTTIGRERRINPFLRADEPAIQSVVADRIGRAPADSLACFTALRAWKDEF